MRAALRRSMQLGRLGRRPLSTPIPALELAAGNLHGRQVGAEAAFLEGLPRCLLSFFGGYATVHERGRLGSKNLLRFVDLPIAQHGETLEFPRAAAS